MAAKVFISYAGRDPQWPADTVRQLGLALEQAGAEVFLDQFYLERQPLPGKPSDAECREWMHQSMEAAQRVICLVSERYLQATRRSLDEEWGYGVAYESSRLFASLYQCKGQHDKWLLTLRPDGVSRKHVPADLQDSCSHYSWPSERIEVLEHATMQRLHQFQGTPPDLENADPAQSGNSQATGSAVAPDSAGDRAAQTRLHAVTIKRLCAAEAAPFLQALQDDLKGRTSQPAWLAGSPDLLVHGLLHAEPALARTVMLAVRRVLKPIGGKPSDATCRAAIALSMLCASRWVARVPSGAPGQVVKVPRLRYHALAVLSAAMFGGEVALVADGAGGSLPHHLYDVRCPAGEDRSTNLLCALYAALHRERMDAVEIARRDQLKPDEAARLLADLRVRLEDIREVDESSFTLVVDDVPAWESAAWPASLGVSPFVLEPELSQDLFAMSPDELETMVSELWRLIQPGAASAAG